MPKIDKERNVRALCKESGLRVIAKLHSGPASFAEIERALPHTHTKVLRTSICAMRRDGLVERLLAGIAPVKVEYVLTPFGAEFAERASALVEWIDANRDRSELFTLLNVATVAQLAERTSSLATLLQGGYPDIRRPAHGRSGPPHPAQRRLRPSSAPNRAADRRNS
jgi:DNA-binding HxlR family transcriptional regulator